MGSAPIVAASLRVHKSNRSPLTFLRYCASDRGESDDTRATDDERRRFSESRSKSPRLGEEGWPPPRDSRQFAPGFGANSRILPDHPRAFQIHAPSISQGEILQYIRSSHRLGPSRVTFHPYGVRMSRRFSLLFRARHLATNRENREENRGRFATDMRARRRRHRRELKLIPCRFGEQRRALFTASAAG